MAAEILNMSVESLGMSLRATRVAQRAGATTVAELCDLTPDEVLSSGFMETAYREISAKLHELGLCLREEGQSARFPRPLLHPTKYDYELFEKLRYSLAELDLPVAMVNALESHGILMLGDIATRTESELGEIQGLAGESVRLIRDRVESFGLTLGMRFRDDFR